MKSTPLWIRWNKIDYAFWYSRVLRRYSERENDHDPNAFFESAFTQLDLLEAVAAGNAAVICEAVETK